MLKQEVICPIIQFPCLINNFPEKKIFQRIADDKNINHKNKKESEVYYALAKKKLQ